MFIQPQNVYAIVGTATVANTIELNQKAINALTAQDPSTFVTTDRPWPHSTPTAELEVIKAKAQEIVANATTNYEKVKLIHDWITNNIYYNYDGLYSGDYGNNSPYAVFTSKIAVCQGYAELTEAMLRSIGIPSVLISGKAIWASIGYTWELEPEPDDTNHAWNAAFVDERWILIDTTWDTFNSYENGTFIKGSTRYNYFDPTIEKFSIDHRILNMDEVEVLITLDNQGGSEEISNYRFTYGQQFWYELRYIYVGTKAGYIFDGWYKEHECINKWSSEDRVYGNTTLYAKWVLLPTVPTSVSAFSASATSNKISWTSVSGTSGYQVFRSFSATGTYTWLANAFTTSYTNSGLTTGTTYYYKVKAYNTVGTTSVFSGFSTIVSAKPIPSAPTGVSAVSASATSAKLSWTSVSGVSGYQVFRSFSATGTYTWLANAFTNSYTNSGLTTGTTYYYKVKAYKTVGTTSVFGNYSIVISAKPIPSAPTGVSAVSASATSNKISWTSVSGAIGYQVFRSFSATGTYTWLADAFTNSYINSGLTTGTTYYYKVKAYKTVGTTSVFGNYSIVISAKPIPAAPTGVSAVSVSATSTKLSWTSVSGASGYQVFRSFSATGTYTWLADAFTTSYTNSGLTTGTTYYYKVKAYKMVGTTSVFGNYSKVISAKPIPTAPTGVSAVSMSATSNKISWTSVSGASGYQVFRSFSATGTYTWLANAFTTSYTNSGLTTGTTYYYKVKAYKTVGTTSVFGNYSSSVSIQTGN